MTGRAAAVLVVLSAAAAARTRPAINDNVDDGNKRKEMDEGADGRLKGIGPAPASTPCARS
uniref:Uncharacterized protein n=1 Tax=Brugia malayi TaxID=6279 RepID=A8PAK7_BRUMA